jgi:Flp pilus assembly protein TadG
MTTRGNISHDRRGASAVEFALIVPVLLAFVFLLIEGARLEWSQQALQQVASETARCYALGAPGCETAQATQIFAVKLARDRGISVAENAVAVARNQRCHDVDGMSMVTIQVPSAIETSLLPRSLSTLKASSCFIAPS